MRKLFLQILLALIFTTLTSAQTTENDIRIYSIFVTRGSDNVTVSWRTEPATKSKLEYADVSGSWQETPWADTSTEQHSITLLNLKNDSSYLYRISAENSSGEVKTKTGSFTTLSAEMYGTSTTEESDNGGFKSLLTPYITPSVTPTPSFLYPNVLGSQNFAYIPMPIMMPYSYQPQGTQPQIVSPTAQPTPGSVEITTNKETLLTNNLDSTSVMLIIGLILGLVASYFIYLLSHNKNSVESLNKPAYPNMFATPNPQPTTTTPLQNTYSFTIKGDQS